MRAPGEYRIAGRQRPSSKQIRASCALSTEGCVSPVDCPGICPTLYCEVSFVLAASERPGLEIQ